VRVVLFTTTTLLAVAKSNDTTAPAAKFVPVIVTGVPPLASPLEGLTDDTVAPTVAAVPPVVKLQIGPVAARLAMVLETIFHRYVVCGAKPERL
jgi:hypothetical protein